MTDNLDKWFLTLLEVPHPTSTTHAFIKSLVVGQIECASSSNSKDMKITIYCVSSQAGQPEGDNRNHTTGMNQITKPLKLTH